MEYKALKGYDISLTEGERNALALASKIIKDIYEIMKETESHTLYYCNDGAIRNAIDEEDVLSVAEMVNSFRNIEFID